MWYLNSTRIFVQERNEGIKNIIARIQTLNTGTTYHRFGYESPIFQISCIVVGNTDKEAIKDLASGSSTFTFTTPYGDYTGVYLASASFKDMQSLCQTIRTDLASDSPVYDTSLEIYLNE